jgi:hypothetical protein
MADIISVLANIYRTNDRFMEEFQAILADRLLKATDFNIDREVRTSLSGSKGFVLCERTVDLTLQPLSCVNDHMLGATIGVIEAAIQRGRTSQLRGDAGRHDRVQTYQCQCQFTPSQCKS